MKSFVSVVVCVFFSVIAMKRELQRRNCSIRQSKICLNFAASAVFAVRIGVCLCVWSTMISAAIIVPKAERSACIWNGQKQHQNHILRSQRATNLFVRCTSQAMHVDISFYTLGTGVQWRTDDAHSTNSKDQRILFHSPWLAAYIVWLWFLYVCAQFIMGCLLRQFSTIWPK